MQFGWTALIRAAAFGNTYIVRFLLEETSAQVNATDDVSHSNNIVFSAKKTAILFLQLHYKYAKSS